VRGGGLQQQQPAVDAVNRWLCTVCAETKLAIAAVLC
jgi:hypothetical protein